MDFQLTNFFGELYKKISLSGVSLSLGTFAICRVENLLCEAGFATLPEMQERDTAKTSIIILTNTEHPMRHLYTSRIYDHYATKPSTPKLMFIRAMDDLESIQEKLNPPQPS
jgi:hypothetical protein